MKRNVEMIRNEGIRIVRGSIPRQVRSELLEAVKNGELVRLKKAGLLPEVFCHPDHLPGARDLQKREAEDAINRISRVMA